jgi:hypothetical protein
MSYILDALKKSDRERPRDGAALPLHEVPAFRVRPRGARRGGIVAAVVLLALTAGVAGAWIARSVGEARQQAIGTTAAMVIPVVPAAAEVGAQADASLKADSAARDSAVMSQPPVDNVAIAATGESALSSSAPGASVTREGLLELWQLTEAEQRYLQGLDVSFHVHSNDPAQRAVIINGLRAKEGQSLGEDLRLAEIVPDGIVLEFQGQFVHLANPQPY